VFTIEQPCKNVAQVFKDLAYFVIEQEQHSELNNSKWLVIRRLIPIFSVLMHETCVLRFSILPFPRRRLLVRLTTILISMGQECSSVKRDVRFEILGNIPKLEPQYSRRESSATLSLTLSRPDRTHFRRLRGSSATSSSPGSARAMRRGRTRA
jgi:hypothetical protein